MTILRAIIFLPRVRLFKKLSELDSPDLFKNYNVAFAFFCQ